MTIQRISQRLDRYTFVSSAILAVVGVSAVLSLKFNFGEAANAYCHDFRISPEYYGCLLKTALEIWQQQTLPVTLAATTFVWFFLYQWAIKNEKRLLDEVLSLPAVDKIPKRLRDEAQIIGLAIAIPSLFIFMAWTVDRVAVYSFIVVALGLADLVGNNIAKTNLEAFLDAAKETTLKAPNQNFIVARRKVVRWYWIECQHYQRISVYLFIACFALFIATNQDAEFGLNIPIDSAYWLLFLSVALNESVMARWRYIRHRKLAAIAKVEEKAIRANAN